jgi:hypothetical protein
MVNRSAQEVRISQAISHRNIGALSEPLTVNGLETIAMTLEHLEHFEDSQCLSTVEKTKL